MSFGNRLVYTQSPGGIRRGLIWQSSEDGVLPPFDTHNYVWDYRVGLQPGNLPIVSDGGVLYRRSTSSTAPYYTSLTPVFNDPGLIAGGPDTFGPIFNSQLIPLSSEVVIELPSYLFNYVTGMDVDPDTGEGFLSSYGKKEVYMSDVDFVILPEQPVVYGSQSQDSVPRLVPTPSYGNEAIYYISENGLIISSDYEIDNHGYIKKSQGQTLHSVQSSSSLDLMKARHFKRVMLPSLPLRFKGKLLFCELDFAAAAGKRQNGPDPDEITGYLKQLLDAESMPSDGDFAGSSTYRPDTGAFFDNFHIGTLTSKAGENGKHYSQSGHIVRYQHSSGIISENNLFTLLFSPIVPPKVYMENDSDYTMRLGRGIVPPADSFGLQARPEIMAPHFACPVFCGGFRTNLKSDPSAWWQADKYYPSYIIPRYTYQGDTTTQTHLSLLSSYGGTTFSKNCSNGGRGGSYSYNSYAYPYSTTSSTHNDFNEQSAPFTSFHDNKQRNFSQDPTYAQEVIDRVRYAAMQPKIEMGEKIISEVEPINALMNCFFGSQSAGWTGQHSGKYKFIGMKGKVSLFEF